MSRIGKKPIEIPQGVEIKIEGQTVTAKGPLGTEVVEVRPEIAVKVEDNQIILSKVFRPSVYVRSTLINISQDFAA